MCFSEISALHSLARCLSSVKQVSIAAVDLGASSGRVIAARVGPGSLSISEANRFANGPVRFGTTLRWDVSGLVRGMLEGLRLAELGLGQLDGAAIDSWAMDYGALDADGALLADPFCYRDDRTVGVMAKAFAVVPRPELYDRTGIQFLPFNTIYQLIAEAETQQAEVTDRVLLIPDLLGYLLTGVQSAEITNASTTQLLDLRTGRWAIDLARRVGIPPAWLPPLRGPGELLGHVRRSVLADAGIAGPFHCLLLPLTTPRRPWSQRQRRTSGLPIFLAARGRSWEWNLTVLWSRTTASVLTSPMRWASTGASIFSVT